MKTEAKKEMKTEKMAAVKKTGKMVHHKMHKKVKKETTPAKKKS